MELAAIDTRLAALDDLLQEQLINWGLCSLRCGTAQARGYGPASAKRVPVSGGQGLGQVRLGRFIGSLPQWRAIN